MFAELQCPPPSKNSRNLARVLAHHGLDLVFDVGANIGQYGQRLRRAGYGGRIVSFEPLEQAHEALTRAALGDDSWTVAPRTAVGDTDGELSVNVSPESDMSSPLAFSETGSDLLDSAAFTGSVAVPCLRLDSVFDRYAEPTSRILLKIDTQGYERPILDGAAGCLPRIRALQVELSIGHIYEGQPDYRQMIAYLEDLGFRPVLFIPGYFNRRTARLMEMDGVFLRG